jgi:hypothetical protein
MGWTAIENAIHSWVTTQTSLTAIWETPNATRPTGVYCSIQFGEMIQHGIDEVYGSVNSGGTSGISDYKEQVQSIREVTVTTQCFAPVSTPGAPKHPPYGDNSARSVLSELAASVALPSVQSAFQAAGISCFDPGHVNTIPAIIGSQYEGRAVLESRFYVLETATGYGTYIETVSPIGATWSE